MKVIFQLPFQKLLKISILSSIQTASCREETNEPSPGAESIIWFDINLFAFQIDNLSSGPWSVNNK